MKNNKDKITVFKGFFDLEKEINWINEMNKKGWKLVYIKCGSLYTFVKTEPDEYVTILHAEDKEKSQNSQPLRLNAVTRAFHIQMTVQEQFCISQAKKKRFSANLFRKHPKK